MTSSFQVCHYAGGRVNVRVRGQSGDSAVRARAELPVELQDGHGRSREGLHRNAGVCEGARVRVETPAVLLAGRAEQPAAGAEVATSARVPVELALRRGGEAAGAHGGVRLGTRQRVPGKGGGGFVVVVVGGRRGGGFRRGGGGGGGVDFTLSLFEVCGGEMKKKKPARTAEVMTKRF
jgi:hypothetical protein